MIKTQNSGQISFFTSKPGVIRGGHYHNTKTEKFLVLSGKALFRFRNLITGELKKFEINCEKLKIIETIPGWIHDIKNIGNCDLMVMLWANEIFDPNKPDTFAAEL